MPFTIQKEGKKYSCRGNWHTHRDPVSCEWKQAPLTIIGGEYVSSAGSIVIDSHTCKTFSTLSSQASLSILAPPFPYVTVITLFSWTSMSHPSDEHRSDSLGLVARNDSKYKGFSVTEWLSYFFIQRYILLVSYVIYLRFCCVPLNCQPSAEKYLYTSTYISIYLRYLSVCWFSFDAPRASTNATISTDDIYILYILLYYNIK